ncbi:hypothetical protein DAEQUDRAFT_417985 [Daedalea quercina L-15889]|uniref:Uncharacterized protein n=1 Tax=Daedalea quercina L-15889 TaxID=1314783 RepID=A0A165TJS9_9APHY|nr:hypothetical protein DAEQUDRAFT_417985 [Daedalea quercina L-15889]
MAGVNDRGCWPLVRSALSPAKISVGPVTASYELHQSIDADVEPLIHNAAHGGSRSPSI